VAVDFSGRAISAVLDRFPKTQASIHDIRNPLPFPNGGIGAVIADLSLHYFDHKSTPEIIADVWRVLEPNGVILSRFNSMEEKRYLSADAREIEPNYFRTPTRHRRFFYDRTLLELFSSWQILLLDAYATPRYGRSKFLLELVARRPAL
jgi:SAM-dependent methyltransferase